MKLTQPIMFLSKVGSRVATVKVRDINSGDNVTITLDKSRAGIQGGPGLRDGESYFGVRWHNANVPTSGGGGRRELSGTVTLQKSLRDDFKVSVARWSNLIPALNTGTNQGKEGIKLCSVA